MRPPAPISLKAHRNAPRDDVADMLRALLERAKRGEIRGIAGVSYCDDGTVETWSECGDGDLSGLYLGVGTLAHLMVAGQLADE